MGSSSVNLIIPVHGAETPANIRVIRKERQRHTSIYTALSNTVRKQYCSETSLTSETGPVSWVHGNYRVRDTRRATHPGQVQSANPENVSAPLYEPGDWETGIFYWSVITLDPVMSANLTPANRMLKH